MLKITWCFRGNTRHPEVTWRIQIQYDPFRGDLIQYNSLHSYVNYESAGWHFVHTCAGGRKRRVWKLRCSRKQVVTSVCANSCSDGWWEELLVERGEHCERCKIGVLVVTSAGVTGWISRGLAGGVSLLKVAGYCVCCCDYSLRDRVRQPRSSGGILYPRHSTSEDHRSVLARKQTWREQGARRSAIKSR